MKCTSDAQIAVARVRSSSSPFPGTGSAVSRTSNRPSRSTTARTAAPYRGAVRRNAEETEGGTVSERIAVMGAGVMGAGIAQVMAIAGHDVVGYDISAEVLATAREGVDTGRFGVRGAVERGKLTEEAADAALARIT